MTAVIQVEANSMFQLFSVVKGAPEMLKPMFTDCPAFYDEVVGYL